MIATRIRVFAALSAPAGGAYPSAKGKASWDTRNSNTKRELELEVEHLPVGLAVESFMDGVKVGSATIGSMGDAELEVRTAAGVVIVTGSFATRLP